MPDWPARLSGYVRSRARTPFAWGSNDCCTFAWGAVGAVTGVEPFPALRGHRTALEAARTLLRHGCSTPAEMMTLALGPAMARWTFAQRGDVVGADFGRGPTMGVCLGANCAFVGESGLLFLPLAGVAWAWRV